MIVCFTYTYQSGPDTAAQRMNWMLPKTMGSPDAFSFRTQELKELELPYDEESVAKSFLEAVLPGGYHEQ